MEDAGGNKRRAAGADEEREQLQTSRGDIGGAACKKVFTRDTPKWIPHATANKPAASLKKKVGDPAKMLEHGVERLQTISDSQRKFAAQFSLPAADRPAKGKTNSRPPGGSRWASKSRKPPKKPGGSPVGSRWAVKPQPPESFASHEPVLQLSGGVARRGVQGKYGSARQGVEQEGRLRAADQAAAARSERGGVQVHHAERELGRENGGGGRGGDLIAGGRGNEGQHFMKTESSPAVGLVKGPWTREEDQKIIDCITNNITRWSEIAERVEGRVGKQCRERWFNHLDPTLKKSSWTPAEDEILVQGQARFGNSWTKIAKLLPGRSENAVKNRWNSAARKKGKTESQNNAADLAKMAAAVSANGSANPEFMGFQQLAMLPDRGMAGPMHYVMVPSFPVRPLLSARQLKPPSVAPPGWPAPSADMNGHMLQFMHAGMPLNMLQGFPVHHHHRPDQHAADPDTSRALGSEGFREQAFGHMATAAPHIYGQPPLPPASVLMAQRMPLGVASHSRPFSVSMPPLACDITTGSEGGLSTGARAGGYVATKRDLLAEGASLADGRGDSLSPEDELSLSNILFNLSLEQNSLGGLACSFGRGDDGGQDSDGIDAPFGGQHLPDAPNGRPPPAGLVPGGDGSGMTGGVSYRGQELNGHMAGTGPPEEHHRHASIDDASRRPRLGATTSVPELLFAPAKARTGERPYYSRNLSEGRP